MANAQNCEHDWHIWPETDGQEQRCLKCKAYRRTPADQLPVATSTGPAYVTLALQMPIELLGAIDHCAQQAGMIRDNWVRTALAAAAIPGKADEARDWACPECGCPDGVAGEPYWTHGKLHEIEAIWTCDRCDHEHAMPYVAARPAS